MRRLLERLNRYWFAESPAAALAVLRILVGGYALWYLTDRYASLVRIAHTNASLFEPVGIATFLDAPLHGLVFVALLNAAIFANIAFLVGWAFRFTGPLFGGLLLCILCYKNSWMMIYHTHNLLVLHVLILGCTRAADSLSVDRLLRFLESRCNGGSFNSDLALRLRGHWRYGWPIRLICAVTASSYFLSGMAKVVGPSGWSWVAGTALRSQVAADALRKELLGSGASPLFLSLYDHASLFAVMGIGALLLELGAPAFLLSKRSTVLWAISMFLFHWGVFLVMGITFHYHLSGIAFAAFLDWNLAGNWCRLRRLVHGEPEPAKSSSTVAVFGMSVTNANARQRLFGSLGESGM
jgi:hypothetical protein